MYAVVISALWTLFTFLLRSVIIRFFVFFALFMIASEFIAYLVPKLPGASTLTSAFSGIPDGVWYFLDLCKVTDGVKLVLTAFVTRFSIRRMPVIG
jgi:hypothetical protein